MSETPKTQKDEYPAFADLPEAEKASFGEWLCGQTVPMRDDGSMGYFPWDYSRWKRGLPAID